MNENFTFEEAIDFLRDRTRFGINLGLQRIEKLLEKMDCPHQKSVKYIHVGGTNGKGSVVAYLAKILQYAGYKVGTFTSPHLNSYTERMRVNGENISRFKVAALISKIKPLLDEMEAEGNEPPTEFEVSTAMALQFFADEKVDYAILEVGLGGAIDSTNVIIPEISVITNVAMDHMDYLGNTLTEIATVKSGIIKKNKPVVTGSKKPEVLAVLQAKAEQENSPLLKIDSDFYWQNRTVAGYEQTADFVWENCKIRFTTKMLGIHQLDNAAVAIMTAKKLGVVNDNLLVRAIYDTVWPARLEILSQNPLVVIDGAHNVDGMTALAAAVREYWSDYDIIAVIGMLADKEREKSLAVLLPLVKQVIVTKVPNLRAGDWQHLTEICREQGIAATDFEFVDDACRVGLTALHELTQPKKMLLVTGSLYMVADARKYLLDKERNCGL